MWIRVLLSFDSAMARMTSRRSAHLAFWSGWFNLRRLSDWMKRWYNTDELRSQSFAYSLFCVDRPFGFSIHRDILFFLSRPFGFSTHRVYIFFYIANFCPNLFILFLVRRDAPFLPGLFFLLSSGSILCEVFFFNCVWVNRGRESFAIHGC